MIKKNKKIKLLWPILLLILINIAIAQTNKVFILNLNYDNGEISLRDKIVKVGYPPDRKIQPEVGYRIDIISRDDTMLYSFKFEIPLDVYVDATSPNNSREITGGLIKLNETDFALTMPYFKDAKEINIYDKENKELLRVDVEEKVKRRNKLWFIILVFIVILVLIYFILKKRKKRRIF